MPTPLKGIGYPQVMNGTSVREGQGESAEQLFGPERKAPQKV